MNTPVRARVRPLGAKSLFFIASILLLTADRLSVSIGGLEVRFAVLPILMGFLIEDGLFSRRLLAIGSIFILAAISSTIDSFAYSRSVAYTFYVIFIFFILIPYFYKHATRCDRETIRREILISYRIISAAIILELFALSLMRHAYTRPALFFYEPSYAAIYITGYFSYSLYVASTVKRKKFDAFLASLALLALGSATGIFGILFSVAVNAILLKRWIKTILIAMSSVAILWLILFVFFEQTLAYRLLFGYLNFDNGLFGLINSILLRGGNRVVLLLWGVHEFTLHPISGIGVGADSVFTRITKPPSLTFAYLPPHEIFLGNPFANPFVEVAGTMGVGGLLALLFTVMHFFQKWLICLKRHETETIALGLPFISMFLAMQLEGNYLRFYIWTFYAIFLGTAARHTRPARMVNITNIFSLKYKYPA